MLIEAMGAAPDGDGRARDLSFFRACRVHACMADRARTATLALAFLQVAACGAGNSSAGFCARVDLRAFDDAVTTFVNANGLGGASAVVVHADCGILHTQGYGSYAADRVYLVGSSSKVVTTGVLMRLADRGLIDIDAPI